MEKYQIIRPLGSGGQGSSHMVVRKQDRVSFALKMTQCANISEANRALNEAKTLQKLTHENVVAYEDVFLHESTNAFGARQLGVCMIMELCAGDLLNFIKKSVRGVGATFSERTASKWLFQMCDALEYIHKKKIMHRDLKSNNVFVTGKDSVKLGDFGGAAIGDGGQSLMGTPCYFSPEMHTSQTYADQSDVWGIGCIAYEMLTLNLLCEAQGTFLCVRVQQEPVPPTAFPASLYSLPLRSLVSDMLKAKPKNRPSSSVCAAALKKIHAASLGPQQAPPAPAANMQPSPSSPVQAAGTSSQTIMAQPPAAMPPAGSMQAYKPPPGSMQAYKPPPGSMQVSNPGASAPMASPGVASAVGMHSGGRIPVATPIVVGLPVDLRPQTSGLDLGKVIDTIATVAASETSTIKRMVGSFMKKKGISLPFGQDSSSSSPPQYNPANAYQGHGVDAYQGVAHAPMNAAQQNPPRVSPQLQQQGGGGMQQQYPGMQQQYPGMQQQHPGMQQPYPGQQMHGRQPGW